MQSRTARHWGSSALLLARLAFITPVLASPAATLSSVISNKGFPNTGTSITFISDTTVMAISPTLLSNAARVISGSGSYKLPAGHPYSSSRPRLTLVDSSSGGALEETPSMTTWSNKSTTVSFGSTPRTHVTYNRAISMTAISPRGSVNKVDIDDTGSVACLTPTNSANGVGAGNNSSDATSHTT